MSNPDSANQQFLAGFMDDYFAECDEHLTAIRRLLLDSEATAGLSAAALEELFRSFHSIKGLSGMVDLRDAELVAHHLESYLRVLRGHTATLTDEGLGALIEGTHALEQIIAARRDGGPAPPIDPVIARLVEFAESSPAAATPAPRQAEAKTAMRRWRAIFTPSPALAARGIGVDRIRGLLREVGDIIEAAPRVGVDGGISFEFVVEGVGDDLDPALWPDHGLTISPIASAAGRTAVSADAVSTPQPPPLLAPSHYVRVDLARLDELMRMIGDMVIGRARLAESLSRIERHVPPVEWRPVQENAVNLERQLRDLREGVMRVRLVPIGEIFRRMPFVVRDLARENGKKVELEMRGQETEIDKFLIERMLDPVLHLVRNAVSHGIETPMERLAAGKADVGRITLSASNVGELVVLEIADDGRGIQAEAVAERARTSGLSVPDGPVDAETLLSILCAPGFSTRDDADRASGRGVGMAVVQTTIEELGGRMSLDSTPGQGSRFVIELPLTLAITDAIIARVGGQLFAVPQAAVREVIEIEPRTIRVLERNEIAPYRGVVLPIVRLSKAFGLASKAGRALHVFVIGQGNAAFGLAVDRIIGQREIVVRALADTLVKVDGVVGATDLGDGKVVLILDAARFGGRTATLSRP